MENKANSQHWSENVSGPKKVILSVLAALATYGLLYTCDMETDKRLILSWDIFCIIMISIFWILFFTTNSKELSLVVEKQDDGLKIIFAIVTIAVGFSVFGAMALFFESRDTSNDKMLHTIISLSPVILSWILLHTIFTVRYAHLYHDHTLLGTGIRVGGIDFPSDDDPGYLDFAYFSFVIGMTFQVSDISVSSRVIRRFVLLHSIVSFAFNTIIVALTINTLAGLKT